MYIAKTNILLIKLLLIFSTYICLLVSCANSSVGPTGGDKDEAAPIVLAMHPENQAKNFSGKELVFTFNEYVQLKEQNKNFSVSPPPSKRPELTIKKKSVHVKFPEALKDSTTYYLNFGNSIVDLNEGNALLNFDFTFSTGVNLDTLVYIGHVVDALSLDPVKEVNVFLYENNIDSIPFLENPSALSKTDDLGVFIIKGLKGVQYKLIVLTDKNANYRYDPASEKIGFSDYLISPVGLGKNDSVRFEDLAIFNMFEETAKRQTLIDYKRPEERLLQMVFHAPNVIINSFKIEGIHESEIIIEKGKNNDSIRYWLLSDNLKDTLHSELIYMKTDSLNMLSPDTSNIKFIVEKKFVPKKPRRTKDDEEEEEIQILDININLTPKYILEHNLHIHSKSPIQKINENNIKLEIVTENKEEEEIRENVPFTISEDTSAYRSYIIKAAWKEKEKYEITFMPATFIDIYNLANDTIIKSVGMPDLENFGKLDFRINNGKDSVQYILQILGEKENSIIDQKIIKEANRSCSFPYLNPGKYRIKIIEDLNSNNKWDTGEYIKKRQAERVAFLVFGTDGGSIIEIKSGWDIVQDIDVTKIFK